MKVVIIFYGAILNLFLSAFISFSLGENLMVLGTNVRRHNMVKKISEYNFIEIIMMGRLFDEFCANIL